MAVLQTMKIKVSGATPLQIDYLVAKCEEEPVSFDGETLRYAPGQFSDEEPYTPSTDWAQGGPIMAREGIGASVVNPGGDEMWLGANYKGTFVEYGPTCLIACLRTYVTSKLGDTVEVPEELL